MNREQWAEHLLNEIGIEDTSDNRDKLVAWASGENTEAKWNPLATTWGHSAPDADLFNSAGVVNYPNLEAGLSATVSTLTEQGAASYGYPLILEKLAIGTSAEFSAAVEASSWGTHHVPISVTDEMRNREIGS